MVGGKSFRLPMRLATPSGGPPTTPDASSRPDRLSILFSTETRDAWLLDPTDRLAAPLARDGDPEPIHIEESDAAFAIDCQGHYRIEGAAFVYVERVGRSRTIMS